MLKSVNSAHAVVALSGGSGSALVAYLLASVFEDSTVACIGVSPSLPEAQLQRARYTADALGARGALLRACMRCGDGHQHSIEVSCGVVRNDSI